MFSNPESHDIFFWNWIKIIILPLTLVDILRNQDSGGLHQDGGDPPPSGLPLVCPSQVFASPNPAFLRREAVCLLSEHWKNYQGSK